MCIYVCIYISMHVFVCLRVMNMHIFEQRKWQDKKVYERPGLPAQEVLVFAGL